MQGSLGVGELSSLPGGERGLLRLHPKLENRSLICSLANDRLSPEQWRLLVRRHCGETTHQALDVAFNEDNTD